MNCIRNLALAFVILALIFIIWTAQIGAQFGYDSSALADVRMLVAGLLHLVGL